MPVFNISISATLAPTVVTNGFLGPAYGGAVGNFAPYPAAWQAPAFQGTWANFGAPYDPVGCYINALGECVWRGGATAGNQAMIGTIPAGFRPHEEVVFQVWGGGAATAIIIDTAGNISSNVTGVGLNVLSFHSVRYIAAH